MRDAVDHALKHGLVEKCGGEVVVLACESSFDGAGARGFGDKDYVEWCVGGRWGRRVWFKCVHMKGLRIKWYELRGLLYDRQGRIVGTGLRESGLFLHKQSQCRQESMPRGMVCVVGVEIKRTFGIA